jgi:hypothetical protein
VPLLPFVVLQLELVGSQLLSSLMGEWGLLQQLQGLVAVSLLASPTVVEWCEACFAAAEAGEAAKRHRARPGSAGNDRGAAAGARPLAAGGYGVVFGVDELDVVELELLLHVRRGGGGVGSRCCTVFMLTNSSQWRCFAADAASQDVPCMQYMHECSQLTMHGVQLKFTQQTRAAADITPAATTQLHSWNGVHHQ